MKGNFRIREIRVYSPNKRLWEIVFEKRGGKWRRRFTDDGIYPMCPKCGNYYRISEAWLHYRCKVKYLSSKELRGFLKQFEDNKEDNKYVYIWKK